MKQVKIYCIYDPTNCKIRYIGRTTVSLDTRLTQHISKSKNFKKYNPSQKGSYKVNWINSLLKNGIRPKIRLLKIVEGWEESHKIEKELISKHFVKHKLVNGDDRGPGNLSKNKCSINEEKRIQRLKSFYSKEENKINFYTKVYVYDKQGKFLKEVKSVSFIAEELGVPPKKITHCLSRLHRGLTYFPVKGKYFCHYKEVVYPFIKIYRANINNYYVDNEFIGEAQAFQIKYDLGGWDIGQLNKNILTQKIKKNLENKTVKIIKNNIAVLERNF